MAHSPSPGASGARRMVASAGALGAAAALCTFHWGLPLTQALAALALASSTVLLHARSLGAQLFVRGLWGSAAMLATMNALVGPRGELASSAGVVVGVGVALTAAGRRGLPAGEAHGAFSPAAFRWPLLAAMTLAVADAKTLLFYGVAWLEARGTPTWSLIGAALALAGVVGLYRMRVWGLLLALTSALCVGTLAFVDALGVPSLVASVLVMSCAVQLGALSPVVVAIARRLRGGALPEEAAGRGFGEAHGVRVHSPRIDEVPGGGSTADLDEEGELAAVAESEDLDAEAAHPPRARLESPEVARKPSALA